MGYILAKEKQCCQGLESSVCSKGLLWICVKEYSNSLHFMGLKAGMKKQKYDKISEKKMLTPIEQPSGKPVLNPRPSAKRIERPSGLFFFFLGNIHPRYPSGYCLHMFINSIMWSGNF
ncbi:uncharacterized protein LOC133830581 [Humulus lupulus]|uniref:uncharacterized protein LOC133830581 n=1 Tax=Humulus lupulus TaxID=3486 RepID=UPI002B40A1BB|nr:uncharacterized protein LOC133830581 [Humulus lupulus]